MELQIHAHVHTHTQIDNTWGASNIKSVSDERAMIKTEPHAIRQCGFNGVR